jgi:hypothetical protein
MRFCNCLLLAAVLGASPAPAREIYVHNVGGDDHRTGASADFSQSQDGPVQTLAKGLRLATSGDRIVLLKSDEPYRESVSLFGQKHSGSFTAPLRIDGNGNVFDGSALIDSSAWKHEHDDVFYCRPRRLAFQQLFISGKPAAKISSSEGEATPDLAPLEWSLSLDHLRLRVEAGKLPLDYDLRCAVLRVGITLYHVHDVIISDLTLRGYQLDAVNVFDGARNVLLQNVTAEANGRAGFAVGGSSKAYLDDCAAQQNGRSQLYCGGVSWTVTTACKLTAGAAPAFRLDGGNLTQDGTAVR